MRKNRLFLIILLGLSLRILAAFHFQNQSTSIEYFGYDESVYYSLAMHMAKTTPFNYTLNGATLYFQDYTVWYLEMPLFHHPPMFVWLLYIWQMLFGADVLISRFPNIFIGTLTIYLAYLIGRRVSENVGLLSAFLISISALNIQQSGLILTDTLLAMLTSLFILTIIRFSEEKTPVNLGLCSVALALSMWTKYYGFLTVSFLLVYVFYKKITAADALKILGACFLLFTPWLLWNYSVYGLPVPVETWKNIASWSQFPLPIYAYVVLLPFVAPFTALGFIGLFKIKRNPLKTGLTIFALSYLLIFSIPASKEMRFILPIIAPLSILAADLINNLGEHYKRPVIFLTLLATAASAYHIVKGGYYWYLPFWHYRNLLGI